MAWVSIGWVLIVGANRCILESKTRGWIGDGNRESEEEWWVECKVLEEEWEGEEKGIGIKASGKVRGEDELKH